jgi:hypothetical protein
LNYRLAFFKQQRRHRIQIAIPENIPHQRRHRHLEIEHPDSTLAVSGGVEDSDLEGGRRAFGKGGSVVLKVGGDGGG